MITKDHLPEGNWRTYQKKFKTRALRMPDRFEVETAEGPLACNDGYLLIDPKGNPYPCDKAVFEEMYEEVEA